MGNSAIFLLIFLLPLCRGGKVIPVFLVIFNIFSFPFLCPICPTCGRHMAITLFPAYLGNFNFPVIFFTLPTCCGSETTSVFFANLVCFNVQFLFHLSDSQWSQVYHDSACQFDSPPLSGFSLLSYMSLLHSRRAVLLSARQTLFSVFKTSDKCVFYVHFKNVSYVHKSHNVCIQPIRMQFPQLWSVSTVAPKPISE